MSTNSILFCCYVLRFSSSSALICSSTTAADGLLPNSTSNTSMTCFVQTMHSLTSDISLIDSAWSCFSRQTSWTKCPVLVLSSFWFEFYSSSCCASRKSNRFTSSSAVNASSISISLNTSTNSLSSSFCRSTFCRAHFRMTFFLLTYCGSNFASFQPSSDKCFRYGTRPGNCEEWANCRRHSSHLFVLRSNPVSSRLIGSVM